MFVPSQGYKCHVKCNQTCPGVELVSSCLFLTTIEITPQAPPIITFLTILIELNNAVIWMVSARLLISKFSSSFYYFTPYEFFTLVSTWSFNWAGVAATLFRSPGLFLVFYLISGILWSAWSPFFL